MKFRPSQSLFIFTLLACPLWCAPVTGTWEGVIGKGTHQFRVAFVFQGNKGEYHNIDDGIQGEPMTLESLGDGSFRAKTRGGGRLEVKPVASGKLLVGNFTQGAGPDSQQSLVGEASYPVTLRQGEDFLRPRLLPDGRDQTDYQYTPPPEEGDGWKVGDLNETQAKTEIERIVQKILRHQYPYIHSLLLVKDGKLVLDEYFYGYGPGDPHPIQSITKDVFSLLFGIADGQGLCGPDQKLFDFFPSYRSRPGWEVAKDGITLESLLTMTSGLGCDDFKDSNSCSWKMFSSPDWLEFSLSLPIEGKPGSHFAYCGACLNPLAAIVEKQSGLSVTAFAQTNLFGPLGIQTPTWWEGPLGFHSPAFGLVLKPRDMAKIGLLVLQKGKWNGRQVVPEKWIEESTAPHVPASMAGKKADYGYLWWERNVIHHGEKLRVLDAWGVGGQHIFIVPALDMVCVMTGGNYKNGRLANNSFRIFHEILEAN